MRPQICDRVTVMNQQAVRLPLVLAPYPTPAPALARGRAGPPQRSVPHPGKLLHRPIPPLLGPCRPFLPVGPLSLLQQAFQNGTTVRSPVHTFPSESQVGRGGLVCHGFPPLKSMSLLRSNPRVGRLWRREKQPTHRRSAAPPGTWDKF